MNRTSITATPYRSPLATGAVKLASGHSDAETYARNYLRYAKAMRAVDPSIKLIAVGDNNMSWNQTVLRIAGEQIDYLAVHHYYGRREMGDDPMNLMARPLFFERFYGQLEQTMRELVPGRQIKLAINVGTRSSDTAAILARVSAIRRATHERLRTIRRSCRDERCFGSR